MSESPAGGTRVALVTGANRGIGLEVSRQLARRGHTVILGSRDPQRGERATARLAEEGLPVLSRQLDVSDEDSVEDLAASMVDDPGRLDVLVNNAAIHYDTWQRVLGADLEIIALQPAVGKDLSMPPTHVRADLLSAIRYQWLDGNVSSNLAPPLGVFSATSSPPWARARSRAMARPRPVPPPDGPLVLAALCVSAL